MQEVFEKIINELESEAERWEDSGKEYNDRCEISVGRGFRNAIEIVKKKSEEYNNGWIPISERLPEEPEEGLTDLDECDEYIVMIENADIPTALNYAGNGEWYRDGEFYNVVAWQPLPPKYQPKGE